MASGGRTRSSQPPNSHPLPRIGCYGSASTWENACGIAMRLFDGRDIQARRVTCCGITRYSSCRNGSDTGTALCRSGHHTARSNAVWQVWTVTCGALWSPCSAAILTWHHGLVMRDRRPLQTIDKGESVVACDWMEHGFAGDVLSSGTRAFRRGGRRWHRDHELWTPRRRTLACCSWSGRSYGTTPWYWYWYWTLPLAAPLARAHVCRSATRWLVGVRSCCLVHAVGLGRCGSAKDREVRCVLSAPGRAAGDVPVCGALGKVEVGG